MPGKPPAVAIYPIQENPTAIDRAWSLASSHSRTSQSTAAFFKACDGAEQQTIDAETSLTRPCIPEIVPERKVARLRMKMGEAIAEEPLKVR
jgi:hypothetical protein